MLPKLLKHYRCTDLKCAGVSLPNAFPVPRKCRCGRPIGDPRTEMPVRKPTKPHEIMGDFASDKSKGGGRFKPKKQPW
jgi:hypothetical protein